MNRKIFFIIIGALLLLALMFGLWFWLFGRHNTAANPDTGSFGSASNTTGNGNGSGANGNGQTPIGTNAGTGANSGGTNGTTYIPNNSGTVYTATTSNLSVPFGVSWLDGSGSNGSGGQSGSTNRGFIPTPINQLNSVDISGIGNIGSGNTGSGGLGLGGAIAGAGIAGIAACTPGLLVGATAALGGFFTGLPVNSVAQNVIAGNDIQKQFLDCIARTIAKIALQQITNSVVDWINSGFNGQPSFVQDYQQFFTDVADQAAGEFIQGSDLAFLCSPFQLQIKIAIAQSYANRRGSSASSCTLTQVIGNVDSFMKGNFSEGGWPGFLSFTTEPTNNPYGAYMHGLVGLDSSIQGAQAQAKLTISPEGFLSTTEKYDCQTGHGAGGESIEYGCKTRIVTPGSTIAKSAQKVLDLPIDENLLADSFDEIIGALINQLLTKTLYGGLANLSNNTSNTAQRGIDVAQSLLTKLQGASQLSQQYGTAEQGSVSDLQLAQAELNTLSNCWNTAASSTGITPQQQSQALANAASADATISTLEARVALYNSKITKANASVATIEQLQTGALTATTLAEVQAVDSRYTAAQNAGQVISQTDVVSAQQDRQTLQSEMTGLNQSTNASLTQCYAFGH